MSLSKEAKIGVLVTASLVIFFTGFYFLKGSDLFASEKVYYCYYHDVDGLLTSAPVQIRGLNVGHIGTLELNGAKGVKVAISVNKSITITEGTIATIAANGFLGNKMVRLDIAEGGAPLAAGATLSGTEELGMVDNLSDQMAPLVKSLRKTVATLDTVIAAVNLLAGKENRDAITATLHSVNVTAGNLATFTNELKQNSNEINNIVHNTNSITGSLAKSNDTIKHLLSNLNMLSGQLAKAPVETTITNLNNTIVQLHDVLTKVNNGQGSIGMMVNDKNLYKNLTSSLTTLEKLMADVNANPRKYVNVTMFGRKPKKKDK